ncbi:hypothetical protein F5Y15DRAFT_413250 [Xylariaceae sp. FL0016]|nr:hypothetical protein F5Y15DRAFT_413250 [Xylariaceae sp. FL0016]
MGISDSLKNEQQRAYFFVGVVFTPISIAAVVLRFWASKLAGRKPHTEDWLALLSLAIYLAFEIVNFVNASVAQGRNAIALLKTPEDFAVVRKLVVKFSIIALYRRLFWVNPTIRKCINMLIFYHIVWIMVCSFMLGFHCRPLDKFWYPSRPGHCIREGVLIAVAEGINSLGDFLLVALVVAVVPTLQTSTATKRRLTVLFGLGVLAGVIGFVKIGISFNDDTIYVFTMLALWSNMQSAVGIVCCCAPVYKPILPTSGFWGRLATKLSLSSLRAKNSFGSRSHSSYIHTNDHDREQYWLQHVDGSARGLVWSEGPRGTSSNAWIYGDADGFPINAIQIRRDVEVG